MSKALIPPSLAADQALALSSNEALRAQMLGLSQKKVDSKEDIEKASSGFEALLVQQMLKAMWETVESSNLFGENSNEGQIYRDMLNQAIADNISEGKGIGVKEFLNRELTKMVDKKPQESAPSTDTAKKVQDYAGDSGSHSGIVEHQNKGVRRILK